MAVGSIVIGVVALIFMIAGFFLSPVPYLGAILSFGSPVVALIGIVMSGVSMSRAKQMGESNGAATAGLVVNIIGFILGLAVALTCGLCNACMTSNMNNPRQGGPAFTVNPGGGGGGAGQLGAELHRISLSMTLATMPLGCIGDPSGAQNARHFHPSVAPQFQGESCQLSEQAIEAYGRSCSSGQRPCSDAAAVAPGSPEATAATTAGLDPTRCYVYTSGTGKIVLCETGQQSQIVHWENVNAVQ